ncbi:MAG: hypothetical protein WD512_13105 [Candidatus Paceibacterota bacterium]
MSWYGIFTQVIIFLFGATAIIDIIGYWPTIKDLYIYKKNSANKRSFALWAATSGVSCLYGIFVLQDNLYIIVSSIYLLANLTVLILTIQINAPKT